MKIKTGMYRKLILLLTTLLVLVLTAACGDKQEKTSEPAAYVPKPEDSMIRVTGSFPLYTDPGVGSNAIEAAAQINLYDALVFADKTGEIKPHLATGWEMSEDGMAYTFHLRQGVKFHDGSEVKADDVAFSMNRMLTLGEGFAYLYTPYVKEAEVKDDYTVVFHMKQTFGPFVPALVRMYVLNKDLVMQHLETPGPYGDMGDYGKNWLLTSDAGSGPYMIKEIKLEEYLLGQKFNDYWNGWEPDAPEFFKILGVNDPVTVRTLMSQRELEIVDEWQSVDNINALSKIEGIEVPLMTAGAMVDFDLNTKKAPTDDVHFRKALAYLMDYDAATSQIYPGTKQAVGPVASIYKGHDPSLFQYKYNKEKALEELKQSKYGDQLDQYPVTVAWSSSVPDEEKLSLVLQAKAAEVGIKIDIVKTPFTSLIQQAQAVETTPNATIMYPGDSYAEAGAVLNLRYHSSTCGTFVQFEWLQDKEIDAAIEKSLSTLDEGERFKQYGEIQQKLVDLCPTIWVLELPERRAYQAAYVSWPEADAAKDGTLNCPIMGRFLYFHDMKVYPEKRAALQNK
ncbi:ABC transporter substrate-binding protein [Candidatus Formimonas warabiya]|uniref:ABC transporter substrate-binding protein n=1 Tax=Formimonas warabiya TaxID=1761012 RepID=A0A3G1KY53_FORW1|nr:ABC transporter substrate-binding protein [Candidatus Formimonas warabiya]ATW27289.1 ABC transporter substrate-binding protein [Candidatus Formimonas warabiya]